MIHHAIRWAPIAALIALTAVSVVFGSLELPDALIYSESTVALILVACVGQIAESLR